MAHQNELLRQATQRLLCDLIARKAMMQGGPNNPIVIEDVVEVAVEEVMPGAVVYFNPGPRVGQVVGRLVPIKDAAVIVEEEGPLEPLEQDLPNTLAPPYVP